MELSKEIREAHLAALVQRLREKAAPGPARAGGGAKGGWIRVGAGPEAGGPQMLLLWWCVPAASPALPVRPLHDSRSCWSG